MRKNKLIINNLVNFNHILRETINKIPLFKLEIYKPFFNVTFQTLEKYH